MYLCGNLYFIKDFYVLEHFKDEVKRMTKTYELQIEIENKCYLDCLHCSSDTMRRSAVPPIDTDSLSHFLQLFDCPVHVYYSGGEPLANPNLLTFLRIVKDASEHNKVGLHTCGILSNTSCIDELYANDLKESGLDDCYLSLYHHESVWHDKITNRNDSHKSTIGTIRNLMNVGIEVKANLVINYFNYKILDETIHKILKLGVSQVRLMRLSKMGAAKTNWDSIGVPYEVQNEAIEQVLAGISQYSGAVTVSGFPKQLACRPNSRAIKCQAGSHLLYITISKQVYPCASTKGNIDFMIGTLDELDKIGLYLEKQKHRQYNDDCINPTPKY